MESQAALEIAQEIYNENKGRVFVKSIVSDDNSTLRAVLKHSRNNRKGKLPDHIPQYRFQADPTHRTKTVATKIYALVKLNKKHSTCTSGDAIRFKVNFRYMLKRNCNKTLQEMSIAARAVINHSFHLLAYSILKIRIL